MLFISSLAFSAALLFVLSCTSSIPLSRNFRVSFFLSRCLIFKVRCHRFSHGWKHIIALSKLIVNRNFSTFWNFFLTFSFVSRCLADSFDIISQSKPIVNTYFQFFLQFFSTFLLRPHILWSSCFHPQFLLFLYIGKYIFRYPFNNINK